MNTDLLWVQVGLLILALLAVVVLRGVYPRLRVRFWRPEVDEAAIVRIRWYQARPVETGILEVAFALAGVSLALPAFVEPSATVPETLLLGFQVVLLVAALLSAISSLLLYEMYVRQLAERETDREGMVPEKAPSGRRKWLWCAGPYSILSYALVFTLIGIALLSVIVAYDA